MNALDNMRRRLNYNGGTPQQSRMIEDKLKSLKKALLYSYQAGTMIIDNPNEEDELKQLEFRCLMNPDKRTFDTDKMMLSVPFEDICLNAPQIGRTVDGTIPVPIKCGKTFIWKETSTRWLVTLQYIEEYAYFRADVRKCFSYPLEIDGKSYYFASIGENEETIEWNRKNREIWNKLNYTREIYLERNESTVDYFKRFKIVKLPNIKGELESWEVQSVSPNATDDILIVHLKEYFENQFEDLSNKIQDDIKEYNELEENLVCKSYGSVYCRTLYVPEALWEVRNKTEGLKLEIKDALILDNFTSVTVEIMNGKVGEFDLYYNEKFIKHVIVESL